MASTKGNVKTTTGDSGGIQRAEDAVLFELLMAGIGLPIDQEETSASTNRLSDGPHPISKETSETITLHYDTELNPNSLLENDLDNGI